MQQKVLFRADGGASIGMGHLMRCLALAEMLQSEYAICFVVRSAEPATQELIQQQNFKLINLHAQSRQEELEAINQETAGAPGLILLDGYHFTLAYERALIEAGHKVVSIDDLHQRAFCADAVVNHAGGVERKAYTTALHTRLCLGPAYALVREVFRQARQEKKEKGSLLLAMGGADPKNLTKHVLALAAPLEFLTQITVVLGPAYRHELNAQDDPRIRIIRNAEPAQLAELYRQADVVLLPSSTMAYEACSVRATLICGLLADNQKLLHRFLTKNHLAADAGVWEEMEAETLRAMVQQAFDPSFQRAQQQAQQLFFDHKQTDRFAKLFSKLQKEMRLHIRRAQAGDSRLYFNWANDPETRRQAINPEAIRWEDHIGWFQRKLMQEGAFLYVLEQDQQPVGQVRFDVDPKNEGVYIISYSIAEEVRGRSLGEAILQQALRQFQLENSGTHSLVALVKEGNVPSFRIFENLSFTFAGKTTLKHEIYWEFRKKGI